MSILLLIFQGCLVIYLLTLLWFIAGQFRAEPQRTDQQPFVSVIVAVRDGDPYLARLLDQLQAQEYPAAKVEFIIADDGLSAQSRLALEEAISKDRRIKVVASTDGDVQQTHKKRALDAGIRNSQGEILLFTDADCQVGPAWVKTIASYFTPGVDYVIGWSQIAPGTDWTSGDELLNTEHPVTLFEQLDFVMLMLAARGTTLMGVPLASTGQNQAYRRAVYERVGGFQDLADRLQGDDSLFLRIARRKAHVRVTYATDSDSWVTTDPTLSARQLILQRVRWAGDAVAMWRFNPAFFPVAMATFGVNALILLLAFSALINAATILPVLIPGILLKAMVEGTLLFVGTAKLSLAGLRKHFPVWFLLQIPYVTIVGLASFWGNRLPWLRKVGRAERTD